MCWLGLNATRRLPPALKRRHMLKTKLTSRTFPRKARAKRKRRLLCGHSGSEPPPSDGKAPRATLSAADKLLRKLAAFGSQKLPLLVSFDLCQLSSLPDFLFVDLKLDLNITDCCWCVCFSSRCCSVGRSCSVNEKLLFSYLLVDELIKSNPL